ncbi:MAG: oligosaccharide flippase family protein [Flavonifractor plautii]
MKLDRTSMLYGTLILTGTSIVSQFLGFVYRILLSRLIGAEVMGLYQLIMPVFSVIMALTAVGLTVAVSNLSSQYHARGNRAAIAQVLRRCLAVFLLLFAAVAAVVVLLYDPISVYLLGDARTQLGLLLLLPCILLTGVENLHKHFFYGTGNIRPPAAVELCEQFIRTERCWGCWWSFSPEPGADGGADCHRHDPVRAVLRRYPAPAGPAAPEPGGRPDRRTAGAPAAQPPHRLHRCPHRADQPAGQPDGLGHLCAHPPAAGPRGGGGLGGHERLRRAVRHDSAHALPAHRLHRGAGPGAGAQAG